MTQTIIAKDHSLMKSSDSLPPTGAELDRVLTLLKTSRTELAAEAIGTIRSKLKAKKCHVSTNRNTGEVTRTYTVDHTAQLAAARLITEIIPDLAGGRFQPGQDRTGDKVTLIFPAWKAEPPVIIEASHTVIQADVASVPTPHTLPSPPTIDHDG